MYVRMFVAYVRDFSQDNLKLRAAFSQLYQMRKMDQRLGSITYK